MHNSVEFDESGGPGPSRNPETGPFVRQVVRKCSFSGNSLGPPLELQVRQAEDLRNEKKGKVSNNLTNEKFLRRAGGSRAVICGPREKQYFTQKIECVFEIYA